MEHKDVTYKTNRIPLILKLDLLPLKDIKKDAPLIIFIPGGGMKKVNKRDVFGRIWSVMPKKDIINGYHQYRLTDVAKISCPAPWCGKML